MKKRILALLMATLVLLAGCSGQKNEDSNGTNKDDKLVIDDNDETSRDKVYKIGIIQYIEHLALDDTREGFLNYLEEKGIKTEVTVQNAQGEISTARTIAEKYVNDGVDLIFAIGTSAAEAAISVTDDIPILYSAVTDPVGSHLVDSMEKPGANVTGTSDASDVSMQLKIFKDIDKNIKNIGIIYSADEANSVSQLESAKEAAKEVGLNIEEVGIQNISDLPQAANSIVKKVDGVYILSDNKIASSISLLADVLIENKIPSVCVEESQVKGGGLITVGLTYYDLGYQTGQMGEKVLVEGISPSDIPSEYAEDLTKYVNESTMEALGLDKAMEVFDGAEFVGE